jgi:hypothetical protein
MDNDRAAAIPPPVVPDAVDDRGRDRVLAAVRPAAFGWNTPGAGGKPEAAHCVPASSTRPVVVGELDVLVEFQPLFVPAPQGYAVDAALSSGDCHRQFLLNDEADCVRSRFWQ